MVNIRVFNEKLSRGKKHGEDAYPCSQNKMVAVADGLGGRGPEQYQNIESGEIYTSAYIGANSVMRTIKSVNKEDMRADVLKDKIIQELIQEKERYKKVNTGITSSMFKTFPTTLACGYIDKDNILKVFWCGDSRVYVLSGDNGLIQITKDDLEDEKLNPFSNIAEGGKMSQYISLSSDFEIHEDSFSITEKNTIIFAASDGVFDYFLSPMHFERFLLRILLKSNSYSDFESYVKDELITVSGDDISLAMLFLGDDSYDTWKNMALVRLNVLEKNMEICIENDRLVKKITKSFEEIENERKMFFEGEVMDRLTNIARLYIKQELSVEESDALIELLPEDLIKRIKRYWQNIEVSRNNLIQMRNSVLLQMTEDYLKNYHVKESVWSNKNKYKKRTQELCDIQYKLTDISQESKRLVEDIKKITYDIEQVLSKDIPVELEILHELESKCEELVDGVKSVSTSGKLTKQKNKCKAKISELCKNELERKYNVFKKYLYDTEKYPLFISDSTQIMIETFRYKSEESKQSEDIRIELEEDIIKHLKTLNEIECLCGLLEKSDVNRLQEFEMRKKVCREKIDAYEKETNRIISEYWEEYRKIYENYFCKKC